MLVLRMHSNHSLSHSLNSYHALDCFLALWSFFDVNLSQFIYLYLRHVLTYVFTDVPLPRAKNFNSW